MSMVGDAVIYEDNNEAYLCSLGIRDNKEVGSQGGVVFLVTLIA
jgi:hypothetical protein